MITLMNAERLRDLDCNLWRKRGARLRLCGKSWVMRADFVDTVERRVDFVGDYWVPMLTTDRRCQLRDIVVESGGSPEGSTG